ncbi:GH1 family beta-glucosidase [Sphingomonas melonis]|nr:GH1 family beta-glucosidase [Sphingomonas melonis]
MPFAPNRREISAGLVALAAASGFAESRASAKTSEHRFPKGFRWGCATAAYQIEGAVREDGRGPSIWDDFVQLPGRVADGSNGVVACDSYHRYREDTGLLKSIGANSYRFSTSWSRIFPEGRGTPNQKGLDHYKRVVDNLLENGIEPYVTLYHWDLPSALPGGWQSRDTAAAFADYAGYMAEQLSDRVRHFMTTNEFGSFVDNGHRYGNQAPGLRLPAGVFSQVRHHALLAHGLGVQSIRAGARTGTRVGLAENPTVTVPVIESPEHVSAARKAMIGENLAYLPAIFHGAYPDAYLASLKGNMPSVAPGDMRTIGSPIDFLGINVYGPAYVRSDPGSAKGYAVIPAPRSFPRMTLPWLNVGPEAAYWGVRLVSETWKPKSIYISENGCVADDRLVDGRIQDTDRIMFLRNYLTHLHRASAEGYPVDGYFLWSLMDNFEWAEGKSKRFGIFYTDFETQRRMPKLSASWYREVIRRNALA